MTKAEVIETIMGALPYPGQISNLDITTDDEAIRFAWRSQQFRVTTDLFVEEVEPGFLVGGDISIILEALLKRAHFEKTVKTEKQS